MAAAAKSLQLQSCLILCYPIDGGPTGSPVPGILHARTLEWVTISSSNAWKWKVKVKSFSPVWLCATPWTAAYQAPPSMGFSRQEYWSWVPLPSPKGMAGPIKVMKEKNLQPRLLYTARISFKYEGGIKSFIDKQKLTEFSTTKPALQQMLKDLL